MKVIFAEARYKGKIKLIDAELDKLPKRIGLASTIQFLGALKLVSAKLKPLNKTPVLGKAGRHCEYPAQILGCDVSGIKAIEKKADCFLYIGTGEFHPLALAAETKKPVFVLNPFTGKVLEIAKEEVDKYLKKKQIRVYQVKQANKIGILVSTKPGQYSLARAEKLKEELEKQGKQAFLLVCDNINPPEALNFPEIDAYINTACPRIVEDDWKKPIANLEDLTKQNL